MKSYHEQLEALRTEMKSQKLYPVVAPNTIAIRDALIEKIDNEKLTRDERQLKYKMLDEEVTRQYNAERISNPYYQAQQRLEQQFLLDLRQQYPELDDTIYAICYAEAYERGHSGGLDEVAAALVRIVSFAKALLKI